MTRSLVRDALLTSIAAAALLALAGCATSPDTRYYVLTPAVNGEADAPAASPASPPVVIGVRPVELPHELDRPQIVTRAGPNSVSVAEFDRWSAPLRESVTHVVGENLAILLPADQVTVYPWAAGTPIDREVVIDVARFDGKLGGECALDAWWQVVSRKGSDAPIRGRSVLTESAGADYASLVAAKSRLLGAMSAEIANVIKNGR